MFLSNLKQFFTKKQKILYYTIFFVLVFSIFTDYSFANSDAEYASDQIESIALLFEGILKLVSVIMTLFTYLSTMFLSPSWINGTLFGLNTYLKDIWILVSNLVYMIFAFILIWIAFMNIVGKEGDQYQLKQALPKFIVGVLIVPFSWFLVQIILTVSSFLTIAALTLPFDVFDNYNTKIGQIEIPEKCILTLSEKKAEEGDDSAPGFLSCPYEETTTLDDLIGSGESIDSIFGIMAMYTFGVLNLDSVDSIDFTVTSVRTIGDLLIKILTDALLVIIYLVLMVALGLVLFVRGIYIWIYMMLSPVFGLMYFFDKKDGGGDGFFSKFNIKEFIALAMVPVYCMLALSFGLLFIFVIGEGISSTQGNATLPGGVSFDKDSIVLGSFTLEMNVSGLTPAGDFVNNITGNSLGMVGNIILKVFGIVLLWSALIAAMRSSEITKVIVEPLHSFGTKVGSIVSSSPGNLPIFGGMSAKGLDQSAGMVKTYYDNKSTRTGTEWINENTRFGSETGSAKELATEIKNLGSGGLDYKIIDKVGNELSGKKVVGISNDSNLVSLIRELAGRKELGISDDIKKNIKVGNRDGITKALAAIHNSKNMLKISGDRLYGTVEIADITEKNINIKNAGLSGKTASASSTDPSHNARNANNEIKLEGEDSQTGVKKFKIDNQFYLNIKDDKLHGFDDYKDMAKYVYEKGMNEDQMKVFFGKLGIKGDLTDIKTEISKYYQKGELKAGETGGSIVDFQTYLDKNKSKNEPEKEDKKDEKK